MIQANELRIGNYVIIHCPDFENKYQKIQNIHQNGTFIDGNPYSISELQPIELTEDVLLKCGFVRYEDKGVVGLDYSEPEEMTIWYEYKKLTIVQWGEKTPFYFSNHNLRVELKYLHTLQNLYYILSNNQELQINL